MNTPIASANALDDKGWQANLIRSEKEVRELLARTHRVAVLGMRTEDYPYKPAFYVPQYLVSAGLEVIPVPVHHPDATSILGQKAYHTLAEIPGDIDLVDVFRRAEDIFGHLEDILAKRPHAVWFQSGIRNDEAAQRLARAGIKVVQDRCLMVDHRQFG
jgi:predicted CoA-binding protein